MMQSGILSGLRVGARRLPRSRRSFASGSPRSTTSSSLRNPVAVALAASSLTYLAINPPTLLLDVFSGVPEPPIVDPRFGTKTDFNAAVKELVGHFGEGQQASTDEDVLYSHGFSPNTYHAVRVPAIVVWPESTEDVIKVMKVAVRAFGSERLFTSLARLRDLTSACLPLALASSRPSSRSLSLPGPEEPRLRATSLLFVQLAPSSARSPRPLCR